MKIIIILFSIIYCLFTNLAVAEEKYLTTYYEFSGNFTTTLNNSDTYLQITIGLSTQYDEEVMDNVVRHNLALRKIILQEMKKIFT